MQAPRRLQLRRGNTAAVSTYLGAAGELIINTDTNTLYVHNGVTVGGILVTANTSMLTSNIALMQSDILALTANAAVQAGLIDTLTGNAVSQGSQLASLVANAAVQAGELYTLTANAASQSGELSSLIANAAVQAGLIANTQSSYGNSNVAVYLANYNGNVSAANIIFSDLSTQTTAYTGTQWRSNLISNVTNKPSWLSYYPGLKNQQDVQYGFDSNGMFFYGNADNDHAYPIRTNIHFHETDVLEVVATIYFGNTNDDHGLAIFPVGTEPIWVYGTNSTRIAYQYSTGTPRLYGQSTQSISGTPILTAGNYYTIKFTYDPTNTVTVETFTGNTASGTAIDSRTISEILPSGDYVIGFDADQDQVGNRSYFTNLIIRTLTNTVINDLEIQGQVTGNLIPSANVTYSLGNITHQWNDLFVSNSTIYMGGVPLGITDGNLTINGNIIPTISYVNSVASTYSNANVASYLAANTAKTINGNIAITGNLVSGGNSWQFNPNGNLVLPTNWDFSASPAINTTGIVFGDGSFQQFAWTGTVPYAAVTGTPDAYGNTEVATYLASGSLETARVHGNLTVGNLTVNGNITYIGTNSYVVTDNIVQFADGNPADTLDLGFVAHRTVSGALQHTGLIRDASAGNWKLFSNIATQPGNTVDFTGVTYDDLTVGNISSPTIDTINANLTSANIGITGYIDLANSIQSSQITAANIGMKGYVDSQLSAGSYGNAQVATYLQFGNIANVSVAGNVTATRFRGNGALLTGIMPVTTNTSANYNIVMATGSNASLVTGTGNGGTAATLNPYTGQMSISGLTIGGYGVSALTGFDYVVTLNGRALTFTQTGNLIVPGNVYANSATITGNVTANYFVGNGALLTGIVAGSNYSNVQVAAYLPTYSGNIANLTVTNTLRLDATKIALGYLSGLGGAGQGTNSVAVGSYSGYNTQGNSAVAIGVNAGMTQGDDTVAIGSNAGGSQTTQAVAVGFGAGQNTQSLGAVAIGYASGQSAQGLRAVAIGSVAGNGGQGAQSIAIGHNAGYSNQPANSIEFNATGTALDYTNLTAGVYITSVKQDTANVTNVVYYNTTTKEVTYGPASGGGSNYSNVNVAAYLISSDTTFIGNTGNVSTVYPVLSNITQVFIGNNTSITSGNGWAKNATALMWNMYFAATGTSLARNTQTGAGMISLDLNGFTVAGNVSSLTANANVTLTNLLRITSAGAATFVGAVTAAGVTSTGAIAVNSASGITSNQATQLIFNQTVSTITMGGAASTINLGTTTGTAGNVFVGSTLGTNNYNLKIRANGQYNLVTSLTSNGGYGVATYSNISPTGGSGTGMIISITGVASGYLGSANITSPGTGYVNGDTLTIPAGAGTPGGLGGSFVLQNYNASKSSTQIGTGIWTYHIEGNLTAPGNITIASNSSYFIGNALGTTATYTGNISAANIAASGNVTVTGYLITSGGYGNISQVDTITANTGVYSGNVTVSGAYGVTMPNRPAFRINGSTQGIPQTLTANVNLKGAAIVVAYNQGSHFDSTTGKFTAPVAGIYSIGLNARVGTNNGLNQIAVLKNGVNTAGNVACFWETDTNAGTAVHFGVNGTIILAVGDYLSANILAGNISFDQNDNWHVTYLG